MKYVSYLFLLGGLCLAQISAYAQDDQYLDDAYLSRKDVKLLQEKAKVKAEAERAAYMEAQKKWQEAQLKREQEYLKAKRLREIDAYNGHLSHEDSVLLSEYRARQTRDYRDDMPEGGYGEYSRRLKRFYDDSNVVVINNPRYVYMDTDDYWYRGSRYSSWYGWDSYYPWYDDYYYPSRARFSMSWGYPRYYGSYYDPWYYGYRYGSYYDYSWYGGYIGGGYWGYYPSYSWGYYDYPRVIPYKGGAYRRGAHWESVSTTSDYPYQSSYGAYESTRGRIEQGQSYNDGTPYRSYNGASSDGTYRGVGRSGFGSNGGSYSSRSEIERGQARSMYDGGSSSSSSTYSAPERSYSGDPSGRSRGRR